MLDLTDGSELRCPIFKLKALKFIKYDNICETLMYGDVN